MSDKVVTQVEVGEYQGHPVIRLPNGRRYGFTFGLGKAKAFLAHTKAVREFVARDSVSDLECSVGEYKKHPTLSLPNGSRHGFTFGLAKAALLLAHEQDIKKFVEDHDV